MIKLFLQTSYGRYKNHWVIHRNISEKYTMKPQLFSRKGLLNYIKWNYVSNKNPLLKEIKKKIVPVNFWRTSHFFFIKTEKNSSKKHTWSERDSRREK